MKISLLEVRHVFHDLLDHKISRYDAEEWARIRMLSADNYELIYDPIDDEDLLWKAVLYLSGVGLKNH